MPMNYDKLFKLIESKGMLQKDLNDIISAPTLTKLKHGQAVNTNVLSSLCARLRCNVSDIMEYEYSERDCKKQESMNSKKGK